MLFCTRYIATNLWAAKMALYETIDFPTTGEGFLCKQALSDGYEAVQDNQHQVKAMLKNVAYESGPAVAVKSDHSHINNIPSFRKRRCQDIFKCFLLVLCFFTSVAALTLSIVTVRKTNGASAINPETPQPEIRLLLNNSYHNLVDQYSELKNNLNKTRNELRVTQDELVLTRRKLESTERGFNYSLQTLGNQQVTLEEAMKSATAYNMTTALIIANAKLLHGRVEAYHASKFCTFINTQESV